MVVSLLVFCSTWFAPYCWQLHLVTFESCACLLSVGTNSLFTCVVWLVKGSKRRACDVFEDVCAQIAAHLRAQMLLRGNVLVVRWHGTCRVCAGCCVPCLLSPLGDLTILKAYYALVCQFEFIGFVCSPSHIAASVVLQRAKSGVGTTCKACIDIDWHFCFGSVLFFLVDCLTLVLRICKQESSILMMFTSQWCQIRGCLSFNWLESHPDLHSGRGATVS